MTSYSRDNYEIEYYRIPNSNSVKIDHFEPTVQSLKAAQDIVRKYEKRRRAAAKLTRQSRRLATPPNAGTCAAVSDNVVLFRSPAWVRQPSHLVYSRHDSPPYALSPAPRAKRALLQIEARRRLHYNRATTPSTAFAVEPAIFEDVQSDMLSHFGVMAIQAIAVVLGLSGLLVLLTLL